MRDSHQISRQKGFTLIEVVIALTLMSLLMLATLTAMRTLGDTQLRVNQVSEQSDELRIVSQLLRNIISQTVPVAQVITGEGYGVFFHGSSNEMTWVAPMGGYQGTGGLHVMRLVIADERQLMLELVPYAGPMTEPDWGQALRSVLLSQVDGFMLSYRYEPTLDWQDNWEWTTGTPTHVRLSVLVDGRRWPDMVMALSAGELQL